MANNTLDDKEPKSPQTDEEFQNMDSKKGNTDEIQESNENTSDETPNTADETTNNEDPASTESKNEPDGKKSAEDDNDVKNKTVREKVKNEVRVFYVEGYGNVNGCKTQAEAEKKAKKLIEMARN